jgi:hypothetical protein
MVATRASARRPGTKYFGKISSSSNLFLAVRIQVVGPIEGGESASGSSKVVEKTSKEKKRERKRSSKGKGKKIEVEDIEVEEGIRDLDKGAAHQVRLMEILARKRVDLEVLEYEIEGIEKMLAN